MIILLIHTDFKIKLISFYIVIEYYFVRDLFSQFLGAKKITFKFKYLMMLAIRHLNWISKEKIPTFFNLHRN